MNKACARAHSFSHHRTAALNQVCAKHWHLTECCAVQKAASSIQIPMALASKWTTIAVDMQALFTQCSSMPYKAIKAIQFCANMRVRGAFTSATQYATGT
jgi:Protein of unknown function (DUF667)